MKKVIIEKVMLSLNIFLGRDFNKKTKKEIAVFAASKIMEVIKKSELGGMREFENAELLSVGDKIKFLYEEEGRERIGVCFGIGAKENEGFFLITFQNDRGEWCEGLLAKNEILGKYKSIEIAAI